MIYTKEKEEGVMDNPQFLKTRAGYEWVNFNRSSGSLFAAKKFVNAMEEFEKANSSLKNIKASEELEM